ncbi:arylsulfatase A-like enzyme [Parabacteroides sp. PF5-5]|uniref:sulfatase family protein n=1 Tax=unclassified Parabacteroides TaxID=2649774 RepID=UPI0024750D5B|nr:MULTISPECIES: arylsulfatase [unclassified Parabacteroides]MDH6303720.1 arylsulfatase A-like enzyme [Parabacteroides sp. PH5-39]MDH6314337.1 arylsulfatase A-like enzyme [Parabacteroides sp. PF5-13]MDH6318599.1 arylsulfatase A-like enzyme [Parabacteroides sp. PH5-13]MDH6322109.1 arylsulfatase A-like enzyme [Parabacteroides sp. PH5-8]MDH6325812.1 arylsulfatase A-like enzyme [Parabacteroides sp. PH5-41]
MKTLQFACLTGAFLPVLIGCKSKPSEVSVPVNVIIILADDIGYGDLSCNGEKTIHTPNVDRLASQGVRFTDAHAVAATSTPSRYSLLTGQYAWRRSDTGIAAGNAGMVIRPEQTTIADVFREAGYTTGAVGKWHLGLGDKTGEQNWNGFITPGLTDIGFDYSYIMAATGDRVPCVFVENQRIVNLDPNDPIEVSYDDPFPGEPLGKDHPEMLYVLKPSLNHGHDQAIVNGISRIGYMKGGKQALWVDENIADSITGKAVQFIENHKDEPFFLYFATNDIHVPRVPHPRFAGKSGMGPRGDAILEFDWSVGQIIETLERLGLADNTLIILSSDNGPVVDDGYQDQAVELLGNHRPWGDFRGGKYSNFEAGTRVPFIVNWPSKIEPAVSDALVSQIDLFASLCSLLGKDIPTNAAPDSKDQLNTLLGKEKKGRDYIIEQAGSISISNKEWKYIAPSNGAAYNKLTNTELGNSKEPQLYHLKSDIGERVNVAENNPEKVAELQAIFELEK